MTPTTQTTKGLTGNPTHHAHSFQLTTPLNRPESNDQDYNLIQLGLALSRSALETTPNLESSDFSTNRRRSQVRTFGLMLSTLPAAPAVAHLPTEILQEILDYLDPVTFNRARHACRAWYFAGTVQSLLVRMLKRNGWWGGAIQDLLQADNISFKGSIMSRELVMSTRLSKECSLNPEWRGDGLRKRCGYVNVSASQRSTALTLAASMDYNALGSAVPDQDSSLGTALSFTVSSCGKVLMVVNDGTVYIHGLHAIGQAKAEHASQSQGVPRMRSVVCQRKILAVSIDISSNRYSIAILLEGRVGLVCDLEESTATWTAQAPEHWATVKTSSQAFKRPQNHYAQPATVARNAEINGGSRTGIWSLNDFETWRKLSKSGSRASLGSVEHNNYTKTQSGTFPVDVPPGARTIYRRLCSSEDPPRSLAICARTKCVAFGCATGIEVHWVDAGTGQAMNRWFSLHAPSDFLYFMPPHRDATSAKRLRLISSAAHPTERSSLPCHTQCLSAPYWTSTAFVSSVTAAQATSSDHFHAVPLRDGFHILFIDPPTGLLSLGTDAPVGGPTKLVRKMMLVGPEGKIPQKYAGGQDLRWGLRIVAGYDDRIFLFCVPPDMLEASSAEHKANRRVTRTNDAPPGSSSTRKGPNMMWTDYWVQEGERAASSSLWPVRIRGAEVGSAEGLVDVAIDSGFSPTVWAFTRSGMAYAWKIRNGEAGPMKESIALRDGRVVDAVDADGDVYMHSSEAQPSCQISEPAFDSFDGSSSLKEQPRVVIPDDVADEMDFETLGDVDDDVVMVEVDSLNALESDGGELFDDDGYWSDEESGSERDGAELGLSSSSAEWVVGWLSVGLAGET